MSLKRWRRLTTTIRDRNPFWTYKVDQYEIPDHKTGEYYYVHTPGSVFVVPFRMDQVLLVRQYRYLNDRFSWEFPGGGMEVNETPAARAEQELIEETGFTGDLQPLGTFNPFNGITDEICHVFLARNLVHSSACQPDDTEEFETRWTSISELEDMIGSNKLFDGMTLAAWSIVRPTIQIENRGISNDTA